MAEIVLSNQTFYASGTSGASSVVGYESQRNRVVRYLLTTPASGASSVALSFTGNWQGAGTTPNTLYFYIGTDANSHANAGASSTKTGTLTRTNGTYNYTGSVDIILMPNTNYYVWVFPSSTTFGWVYFGKNSGDAVATTSGGAVSSFTIGNGTLGTAQTITVTKHNSGFTHTIKYVCGTASGTICDKAINTSITWTPPADLAKQNTVGTVVSVAVTLQTYNGSTAIGDPVSKTVTMTIPDMPSIDLGVADVMGYESTYGAYIKSLSRFSVAVVASSTNGASIVSYRVTANGTLYTEAEFFTDPVASLDYTTITATVTDSRGRTATATKTVSIMDYAPPAITAMSAFRCDSAGNYDDNGEYVSVKFSATATALNNLNRTTALVHWRKNGAADYAGSEELFYETQQYSITDYSVIIGGGISVSSSYDVEIALEDNFIGKTRAVIVPTSFALMHFRADGTGMAFGKLSEKSDAIEFGLPIYNKDGAKYMTVDEIWPVNSIYISYSHTSPAELFGGTWTRVIHDTGAGTFLYGCTAAGVIGECGGEAAHTLTIAEMPAHNHPVTTKYSSTAGDTYLMLANKDTGYQYTYQQGVGPIHNAGGGQAHNNIPPYIKVSIWRRTA